MPFLGRSRSGPDRDTDLSTLTNSQLLRRYRAVSLSIEDGEVGDDAASRALLVDMLAAEVLTRDRTSSAFWYDRGMYAKWRRDWSASRDFNNTALDLLPARRRGGQAAAWNLGIAATALHDWPTARRAWDAFGIPLPDAPDDEPIEADFGPAPLRLNAEPRFVGEEPLRVDGRSWHTEVVWGQRLCPTRIRVLSVPTPESGHRFGDIVLHDGDPVGSRRLHGEELGVFNEIALWERSTMSTFTATVEAPGPAAVDDLVDLLGAAGGAEDWTSELQMLCRACSEGSPESAGHHHAAPAQGWDSLRSVGLAAAPAEAERLLDNWAAGGPGRSYRELALALP